MSPGSMAPPVVRQVPLVGGLVLLWILLWGVWSWANLLSGLVVAVAVISVLRLPPVTEHARFRPLRVAAFVGWFLGDLLVSSAQVTWIAMRPGPVRSAIIAVQLRADSDLLMTLLASTVNLVPGSLVLDVDRGHKRMLLHVLIFRGEADVEGQRAAVLGIEERIVRAFGSAREVSALEVPTDPRPPKAEGAR